VKRALARKSLLRAKGSSRPKSRVSWHGQALVREKAKALGGAWTTRQMAEEMKRAWNCGSVGTVHRIAMELGYRRMRMTTVPMLTDSHKAQREKWVSDLLQREDGPFGDCDTVYIHVDEKWFYGLRPSKWFWVAKDEDRPVTAILSRSPLNKVMFSRRSCSASSAAQLRWHDRPLSCWRSCSSTTLAAGTAQLGHWYSVKPTGC
jgi:hypothetical protein